jgi:HPt (histidine-containing phosphotransfer) domain-containing protein
VRPGFKLGGLLHPLLDSGHEDDAREVVELYLAQHREKSAAIREAASNGDLEACAQAAHSLIGSTGGIGASQLADALTTLETVCRRGAFPEVESAIARFEEESGPVLDAAGRFLAEGSLES